MPGPGARLHPVATADAAAHAGFPGAAAATTLSVTWTLSQAEGHTLQAYQTFTHTHPTHT